MTDTWQFTPFIGLYLLAIVGSFVLAFIAWKMRPTHGATQFCLLTLSTGIWTTGYLLGFMGTSLAWKLALLRVEYLGVTSTNFFWILFAIAYSHHEDWLTKKTYLLLGLVPALTYLQILTVEHHNLIYHAYELTTVKGFIVTQKVYGLGFYFWAAYSYLILLFSGMILIASIFRLPDYARGQAIPPVLIMGLVFISNFLLITGHNPLAPHDLTPLSFVIAAIFFMLSLRRYGFLHIVPVAHNLIFKNVASGVVIIDEETHILDLNPAAEKILGHTPQAALGKPIVDIFPQIQHLLRRSENSPETEIEIEATGQQHIYEVQLQPMHHHASKPTGFVLLFYDITQRKQMAEDQNHLILELQSALEKVETLSGLLPICANCKKIRDDTGYWHQVESYISDHSSALFSHGICPECAPKIYPEYFKDEEENDQPQ